LNETVNRYINRTALTSLQDFWCQQDGKPPHVAQVRCAISDSNLPREKNGWQEMQWSARSQDLFPVSFVGTLKSSCMNTTGLCRLNNKCTELNTSLFTQWLLHVSTRQCHLQGAVRYLLSYLNVNWLEASHGTNGRTYVPVCYALNCDGTLPSAYLFHHSSLYNTPVHRFYHLFHDLPPTNKVTRKERNSSLKMAMSC
jgi:hypothetical protein